ncbi:hypothetical protein NEMBOFW57_006226 [Staphylotrichum longicolle]|uniref:Amino acid permease/ SLC12A domain-containing protein n=1 Tax=Staphylotrichum longicolle TaxID=669026 RepID=A0AAD4HWL8_9PEZI|nr:hypothetical protein NEMBOFW57_006226 [Staphylotrichum longicolle]
MALDDIEMNRLGRTRSPAEASSITARGPTSIISDAGTPRPAPAAPSNPHHHQWRRRHKRPHGPLHRLFRRDEDTAFSMHVTDTYSDYDPDHDGDTPTNKNRFGAVPSVVRQHQGERYYDLRAANAKTASTMLARELKGRHLQMIAISGSIGTGLFVASGKALSQGGPASVLLAYVIAGVMLWCTMQALEEMAVRYILA